MARRENHSAYTAIETEKENQVKIVASIIAGVVGLVFLATIGGSFYTIDQGERGVLLRNGAISGVAEPGLGLKVPWIDSVREFSVQSRVRLYENMATYSRDQQTATLQVSVNYRMPADQVSLIYSDYGSEDALMTRLLDRRVYEETKTVFGQFNAITAIQERGRLNQEVADAIQKAVIGPIIIDGVQIENIDFSDAYEASIEARMLAEVEVQKVRQNADREKISAEIAVTQAKGRADSVRAEAEAAADAIRLRGLAEAEAIDARGQALRDNPALISLVQAEKWDGVLPTTMPPNGTVPFLNLSTTAASGALAAAQ